MLDLTVDQRFDRPQRQRVVIGEHSDIAGESCGGSIRSMTGVPGGGMVMPCWRNASAMGAPLTAALDRSGELWVRGSDRFAVG